MIKKQKTQIQNKGILDRGHLEVRLKDLPFHLEKLKKIVRKKPIQIQYKEINLLLEILNLKDRKKRK